jgi:hypothetical protein
MVDVTKTLRDATYVAIGMGVMTFQKSQVRRVELTKQFEAQRKQVEAQAVEAKDQLGKLVKGVEERWEPVLKQLETRLDELEKRLPEQAATAMKQVRAVQADLVQRLAPNAA